MLLDDARLTVLADGANWTAAVDGRTPRAESVTEDGYPRGSLKSAESPGSAEEAGSEALAVGGEEGRGTTLGGEASMREKGAPWDEPSDVQRCRCGREVRLRGKMSDQACKRPEKTARSRAPITTSADSAITEAIAGWLRVQAASVIKPTRARFPGEKM